jgi:hypothetical protein
MPNQARGTWGVGTMHHVAWRVADDAVELRVARACCRGESCVRPRSSIDSGSSLSISSSQVVCCSSSRPTVRASRRRGARASRRTARASTMARAESSGDRGGASVAVILMRL